MNYIIYGLNKVAKDFIYIFDNLNIVCIIDDRVNTNSIWGYQVSDLSFLEQKELYDKIIICDFDKKHKENELNKMGYTYQEDYLYEEDFFESLNEFSISSDRQIAIWGTGNNAKNVLEKIEGVSINFFIDNNKTFDSFNGYEVKHPNEINDFKRVFIIISVNKDIEIKKQLKHLGLTENVDFIPFYKYFGRPSEMLRKTIFDKSIYNIQCNTMLNHLEIINGGNTRCCCTTFVEQNLDNIFVKSQNDLWHSNLHKIMCLSSENKTYSFCNKKMCPLFVNRKTEEYNMTDFIKPYNNMKKNPEVLALGYDPSCNLKCSTCRKELHFAKGTELEIVNKITNKVIDDYLSQCDFLILAGDGEVFACDSYRKIYEASNCKPRYIRLLTNGTLFTEERWNKFINGKDCDIMLTVSIDAATKETYEKIRCNGNFEMLKENMKFASKLRKTGDLKYFRINFVVQRENYKEMIAFVKWGEELGVDEVFFTKILNWGTYTDEEFESISMMEKDEITPKKELQQILESDEIVKSEIVDLGTIQYGHKEDYVDDVENYYMWELEKRGGKLF